MKMSFFSFYCFADADKDMKKEKVKYTEQFDGAPISSPSEDVIQEENKTVQDSVYDRAARVIQRTWRKHTDITVFKSFKSLVNFRSQGDPRLLLKYINPREADMLDAASGVYIRFRLGGTEFPPNIYYKIFTHRPIVDLCASSPKDYTHAVQKRLVPQQLHNSLPAVHDDCSGWYRRVENNGWRLLTNKVLQFEDSITQNTNNKRTEFHHCKLHRQQDVERRKKMRKIEWMRKMYDEGVLCARTEHRESAQLVENSTQGMIRTVQQQGPDTVLEWEVDELIEWTNALNFDEYLNEWKDLGTSNSSVFRTDKVVFSQHDPCEFSQLTQDSSQVVTNSTVLRAHMSSLLNSEFSRVNISDLSE